MPNWDEIEKRTKAHNEFLEAIDHIEGHLDSAEVHSFHGEMGNATRSLEQAEALIRDLIENLQNSGKGENGN